MTPHPHARAAAALAAAPGHDAAERSVRCPRGCGGWTWYETDAIGRTVERCRCGWRQMLTGRAVPVAAMPASRCVGCGEPVGPAVRYCGDACRAAALAKHGAKGMSARRAEAEVRRADVHPCAMPGCGTLIRLHQTYCSVSCRNRAGWAAARLARSGA